MKLKDEQKNADPDWNKKMDETKVVTYQTATQETKEEVQAIQYEPVNCEHIDSGVSEQN